jgi:peptide/nickel transport system permease protein
MTTYIVRRFIAAIVVLIIVSIIVFVVMRLLPGDPIRMLVGQSGNYTEEQIIRLKTQLGLDKPIYVQYIKWIGDIFHGDLGRSIVTSEPVTKEIFRRLPITLHLGLSAFVLAIIMGIIFGIICAVRRGSRVDTTVITLSNIGITVPTFWLGLMLMYVMGFQLKWLPLMGYTSPFEDFWLSLKELIMPVICLAMFPIASITRQTRSSMLEVMKQDYIRTAYSKGLRERNVIIFHALINGLIPITTYCGIILSMIVGGSVIIETVFSVPGMGMLAVDSIISKDYPYIQGIILTVAVFVMMINLLVDIAYGWLDPRIKYG